MALKCDACKSDVPAGTRFCPGCGLEVLEEHERPHRPSPPVEDAFDWSDSADTPSGPKEYSVTEHRPASLEFTELRARLQKAQTRLADGFVHEAAETLRSVRPQIAPHPSLRPKYDQLCQVIEKRKQAIRDRVLELAAGADSDPLLALLVGPAVNDLESDEICAVALSAAHALYEAHQADEAMEVLRLSSFKTLRDEALVGKHRELEALVYRRRHWQHLRQSVLTLGSVSIVAGIGLVIWAWFIAQAGLGGSRSFMILGLLAAAVFLIYLPTLRPFLDKKLRQFQEEKSIAERWHDLWNKTKRRRR